MEADLAYQTVPITEFELKRAISNFSDFITHSRTTDDAETHADLTWYRNVLDKLVKTCASTGLRPSHRAAACNAICCYINLLGTSSTRQIRGIVYEDDVDLTLLSIYLERFDNAKSRAMKQLLSTTLELTYNRCKSQGGLAPLNIAATRLIDIILIKKDNVKIKPALSALNAILGKHLLTFNQILELYLEYSPNKEICLPLEKCQQNFLEELFSWVIFPEVASLVGQIAATTVAILAGERQGPLSLPGSLPLWASPLCTVFKKYSDQVDAFTAYLIPHLMKTEIRQIWMFLTYLKIDKYFPTKRDAVHAMEISFDLDRETASSLLFACLQVGKEIGTVEESGDIRIAALSDGMIWLPDKELGKLLSHSSRSVRFSALRILVASRFSSRPFKRKAIVSLTTHLPHMLADSDTKFRSEVLNTVKTVLDRLRNATANLNKRIKDFEKQHALVTTTKNNAAETENFRLSSSLSQLRDQKDLLQWLIDLPRYELHSGASYQRHFSALKILQLLVASGIDNLVPSSYLSRTASGEVRWPFHLEVVDEALSRLLFDLLLDPYDDIRNASLKILKIFRSISSFEIDFDQTTQTTGPVGLTIRSRDVVNPWPVVIRATDIMMKSGRVDSADGAARMYDLASTKAFALGNVSGTPVSLDSRVSPREHAPKSTSEILRYLVSVIEEGIALSKFHLSRAVESHPMHGHYLALRYIVENVEESVLSSNEVDAIRVQIYLAVSTVFQVWNLIRDTLCNDAPEGFLPEDVEEEDEFTTKDLLSFCWRSLKESSLFLRSLVSKCRVTSIQLSSLVSLDLEALGNLCFEQLAELRHPGALSTVAQTFTTICQKSRHSKNAAENGLRNAIYLRTLHLIKVKGGVHTRRSAGLPAIVVALLSADTDDVFFDQVTTELKHIASTPSPLFGGPSGTDLPQVHAMNSLRAIFTATGLGMQAERHIVSTMKLAAYAIQSETWAIRNCSLMLFRSLTDRLLGSHETSEDVATSYVRPSSKLSYSHYPGLLDIIIDLLASGEPRLPNTPLPKGNRLEALFPSLDLIRRSRVPSEARIVLKPKVLAATANRHWHVRKLAAQAYASLVIEYTPGQHLHTLLAKPVDTHNGIHGTLLCLKYIVRSRSYLMSEEEGLSILDEAQIYYAKCSPDSLNTMNLVAFVDGLCEMAEVIIRHKQRHLGSKSRAVGNITTRFLVVSQPAFQQLESSIKTKTCSRSLGHARDKLAAYIRVLEFGVGEYNTQQTVSSQSLKSVGNAAVSIGYLMNLGRLMKVEDFGATTFWLEEFDKVQKQPSDRYNWKELYPTLVRFSVRAIKLEIWVTLTHIRNTIRKLHFIRPDLSLQSPSDIETSLCMWALVINANLESIRSAYTSTPFQEGSIDILDDVQAWVGTARYFLAECNHFSIRYAALLSVMIVCNTSHQMLKHNLVEPELLLAIHDSLNDDDEKIRELAADIVYTSIPQSTREQVYTEYAIVPKVSSKRLFKYIIERHKHSPLVYNEAIRRISTLHSTVKLRFVSFSDVVEDAKNTQGDLFRIERQNLYIDDIEETAQWAAFLKYAGPKGITKQDRRRFVEWVSQSLDDFLAEIARQPDGPLGLTSNPNIFAFSMRVLCATEVALTWRERFLGLRNRGWQLQLKLAKLALMGQESQLHPLLVRKANGILRRIICQRVVRVGQMVRSCNALVG